jgi:Glycosyl hydrolase family 79 C-terminal beta domain
MRFRCTGFLALLASICLIALSCRSSVKISTDASGPGTNPSEGTAPSAAQITVIGGSSVRIGSTIQFSALANNLPTSAVTWAVNGSPGGNSTVGTISTAGLYSPPAVIPIPNTVTISAKANANSSSGSLIASILNSIPVLAAIQPTTLILGVENNVILSGAGYARGASILVNGIAVSATYVNSTQLTATISGTSLNEGSVTFAVANPDPGGSISNAISISASSVPANTAQIGLTPGLEVPQNFLGMSYEWGDSEWVMGWPSVKINTSYRRLLKNLMVGHDAPMLIRIGGASTDQTGMPTDQTIPAFASLASDMNVHFSFGVNLGSDNLDLAVSQAQAYVSQMPAGTVDTIEIGNEPDNYVLNGMRPASYTLADYLSEYAKWGQGILPTVSSSTGLMGPSWGGLPMLVQHLPDFESAEAAKTSIISHHRYAGYQDPGTNFASDFLLTPSAASAGPVAIAPEVPLAHKQGQVFRIGEFNSIDGGGIPGISDTFGSALWAVDTMFEYVKVGVDGVNWHGISGCTYCAFTFNVVNDGIHGNAFYLTQVKPLYYGMLFFQKATGNHAKMLPVALQTSSNIKVWATMDNSSTVAVVILNKDESFSGDFAVMVPGYGDAQAIRLTAPSYQSTSGVTLNGQTFEGSTDGNPIAVAANETIYAESGIYKITLQPTSAVLLVLKK